MSCCDQVVVIAGTVAGQTAPTTLQYTPMSILHVKIAPAGHFAHSAPAHHNCFAYVRRGTMTVGSSSTSSSSNSESSTSNSSADSKSDSNNDLTVVPVHCLVYFQPDGDSVRLYNNGSEELDFMLFEGQPMHEPRAASGQLWQQRLYHRDDYHTT
jgi:redox-sensitive bicupin YhaK (pirin superfamily)